MTNHSNSPLEWLMTWYQSQCNGDWEQQNGIRIATLDNPGWSLDIDLTDTYLDGFDIPKNIIERSDTDWIFIETKDKTFRARGGPGNLSEMIRAFAEFAANK